MLHSALTSLFFFQAEDGIRDRDVTGVQTCALPISHGSSARNVSMMLDRLWFKGEIMIVGRDGQQRIWDLAERSLPVDEPRPRPAQVALEIMGRQLHARSEERRVGKECESRWSAEQ